MPCVMELLTKWYVENGLNHPTRHSGLLYPSISLNRGGRAWWHLNGGYIEHACATPHSNMCIKARSGRRRSHKRLDQSNGRSTQPRSWPEQRPSGLPLCLSVSLYIYLRPWNICMTAALFLSDVRQPLVYHLHDRILGVLWICGG